MASPVSIAPNRNIAFTIAFFEELVRAGVRDVCLCPGSRSAPLAVAIAQHDDLRCWNHIDERAAAFFALGLAKAQRAPVALVCTSGTAAANFLPAVVEAHYAGVPLIVLTADRPAELRECGAGQTIDQVHLYGRHVRWFFEVPIPEPSADALRTARSLASRATAESMGAPRGPVHLNFPFREPLDPRRIDGDIAIDLESSEPLAALGRPGRAYVTVSSGNPAPLEEDVEFVTALVRAHPRGVIACGPLDDAASAAPIAHLARLAGWPVLAEPTSQLRCGAHVAGSPVIAHSDMFLRDAGFAEEHAPDAVLRIGATPTSKAQSLWIERHAPQAYVLVDPDGFWNDPNHLASHALKSSPGALCAAVGGRVEAEGLRPASAWLDAFVSADRSSASAIAQSVADESALLEPAAIRELGKALPDDALLYVSNSMPVRDLDAFLPASSRALRVLCNRGANGIDGMVSSALGAAAVDCGRVFLLTGDLALAHDIGGLMAAHRHGIRATIIVFNNDGGGIFSFLPIANHGSKVRFEENFRTPHGLDFSPIAAIFKVHFTRVETREHFRAALKESIGEPRTCVIEIPVDRDRSVAHHRSIERAVSLSLAPPAASARAENQ